MPVTRVRGFGEGVPERVGGLGIPPQACILHVQDVDSILWREELQEVRRLEWTEGRCD